MQKGTRVVCDRGFVVHPVETSVSEPPSSQSPAAHSTVPVEPATNPPATPRKMKGHAVPVDGPGANKPPLHAAIATAGTSHGGQWHAWVKHCEYPRGGGGGKAHAPARANRTNNFFIILASI